MPPTCPCPSTQTPRFVTQDLSFVVCRPDTRLTLMTVIQFISLKISVLIQTFTVRCAIVLQWCLFLNKKVLLTLAQKQKNAGFNVGVLYKMKKVADLWLCRSFTLSDNKYFFLKWQYCSYKIFPVKATI